MLKWEVFQFVVNTVCHENKTVLYCSHKVRLQSWRTDLTWREKAQGGREKIWSLLLLSLVSTTPSHNSFPLCLLTSLWLACSPMNFGGAETVKVKFQGRVESSLTRAVHYPTLLPSAFFWKGIPGNRTCLSLKQAVTLTYTPISAVGDPAPNRKASPSLP